MITGPCLDPNLLWIFFIFYTIVGCFFFLNLFMSVVISTFITEYDKLGGNNFLAEEQMEWIEVNY